MDGLTQDHSALPQKRVAAAPEARATILKAEIENAKRLKKIKQLDYSIHKRP